jgi:cytochrome P450
MAVHVVDSIDLQLARDIERDPFEAFDAHIDMDPFWAKEGDFYDGGFWVIGKFDQCRELLQDAETFQSEVFTEEPLLPSFAQPPELQKLRQVLLPHLSRRKTVEAEDRVRELANHYIDAFAAAGSCDLVADFAQHFPIAVFAELYGIANDKRAEFRQLAEKYLHSVGAERDSAWESIRAIVRGELEERRVNPRGDLLSGIANGEIDGAPIEMAICVNLAATVFLGGLDTLPSALGWTFRYLATHEDARRRVREQPETVPAMVEEFLRLYPVVAKERRRLSRDVDFHGVHMKAGDRVVALLSLANRDEVEFPNARTADFDRTVNRHITFGVGPHRCLGSHLARSELTIALQEWHRRIPDYRISDPSKIRFHGGIIAMSTLPLEWATAT